MAITPPYLKHGDCIGVVCPAGFMPADKVQTCLQVLDNWGYQVKVGTTVGSQCHYFSGTDEERLADLQQMLDDEDVHAILCARGGYGLTRMIDKINFKKFCRKPKWIIGFSDISVLHSHIHRQYGIATLHAPMAAAFNSDAYKNEYVESLRNAVAGIKADYICDSHAYNKKGSCSGELVGGNLSLIAHLCGTESAFKTRRRILFLEDVSEYIYNVDRMFYQLKRNGMFDRLAGLIIGGFTDMKDTTTPFGKQVYDVIHDLVKNYDYPIAFGFPVSHDKENLALKIGREYKLTVAGKKVRLMEK